MAKLRWEPEALPGDYPVSPAQNYEIYLRDGIDAVKEGRRESAIRLLEKAISFEAFDARAYIWLSATTDDPLQQKDYLEKALVIDPVNAVARRGLAMLNGLPDPQAPYSPVQPGKKPATAAASGAQVFLCPGCGGRMSFQVQQGRVACEYCGRLVDAEEAEAGAPAEAHVLDYFKSSQYAAAWSSAEQQLKCARCGALSILPCNQKSVQCPYCGSNQVVPSHEHSQLMPPQAILVMQLDEAQAVALANRWLGRGVFAPDGLDGVQHTLRLRPAYYSAWVFDGMLELRWDSVTVERHGMVEHLAPAKAVEQRLFSDLLVPGVKAIPDALLERLGRFDLERAEPLQPEHLAGWPAILYDVSLADASHLARAKAVRRTLAEYTSLGQFAGPFGGGYDVPEIRSSSWNGMTCRHVLIPLWLGAYRFQGRTYRLYINGQAGTVAGEKPVDWVKVVLSVLIAAGVVGAVALIAHWLAV